MLLLIQERLINWGYAVTDAAVRRHVDAHPQGARALPGQVQALRRVENIGHSAVHHGTSPLEASVGSGRTPQVSGLPPRNLHRDF